MNGTFTSRALAALAGGLLALTGCGSDASSSEEGGAPSTEEFCTTLGTLAASDGSDAAAALQDLASEAPDDIADDMGDFADLFAEMSALDADGSEQAQSELMEKMEDYEELTGRLDAWANENCPDLPEDVFTSG